MPQPLSGPGLGLPLPQNLYPTPLLNGATYDSPTNRISLAAGDALVLPAGDWYIDSLYSVVQYLDPVTNTWHMGSSAAWGSGVRFVKSDGYTVRLANLTGCVVGATILATGSDYVQSTTSIAVVGASGVAATPIIGGALAVSGGTLTNAGAGYGVAPIVFIPAPAPAANNANGVGGRQAVAFAGITNGTVSFVSLLDQGAGYAAPPTAVILPNPTDPNIASGITQASVAFTLTGAGGITGALFANNGAPIPNGSMSNVSLVVSGAGTGASLTAVVMQTVANASATGAGVGYGANAQVPISSVGGTAPAGSITASPAFQGLAWRPRPAQIGITATAGGTVAAGAATIYDGGLFLSTPGAAASPQGVPTTVATLAFQMGSRPDIVTLQPAP